VKAAKRAVYKQSFLNIAERKFDYFD